MDQNELIHYLEILHFSKLEASIYVTLIKEGEMTGYQLAKKIERSRPAIYNTLDHMYDKGMVYLIPDQSSSYKAVNPNVLLTRLKDQYMEAAGALSNGFDEFLKDRRDERFLNMRGFDSVIYQAKEMLLNAKEEVYLNLDFDVSRFCEEFSKLAARNVRIIMFSFYEIKEMGEGVEYYSHNRPFGKNHLPSRLMVAVDDKEALIADGKKERGTWLGTVTNNSLMIKVVKEHIHNDIYLLKLRDREQKKLFDDTVFLHTKFEINHLNR